MPGFDRTGPMGMGPRTGGGFGFCAPGRNPATLQGFGSYYMRGAGRGFRPWGGGRGRVWGGGRFWGGGRGRGWGVGYGPGYAPWDFPWTGYPSGAFEEATPEQELRDLQNHARTIEQDLKAIHKRIKELESASGKSDPAK